MKVMFLDFDGVLNSHQSATFWHHNRDKQNIVTRPYREHEFCPIAISNMEELMRRMPDLKIVVSSTWRMGRSVEELKIVLASSPLMANAVIDKTLVFHEEPRGKEIKAWLDKHPEISHYVIVDDDSDMLKEQREYFVHTSGLHGFQYGDMLWAERILNGKV